LLFELRRGKGGATMTAFQQEENPQELLRKYQNLCDKLKKLKANLNMAVAENDKNKQREIRDERSGVIKEWQQMLRKLKSKGLLNGLNEKK